ncbi:MAG: thioredoxin family protein [Acidobacteria bacterium]|nr:thioredoxin family protein [Acidobacteriota bacterium]
MKVQILIMKCPSCETMRSNVDQAVKACGFPCEVEYVSEILKFIELGVAQTPALVINGRVISSGKVMTVPEVIARLQGAHDAESDSPAGKGVGK